MKAIDERAGDTKPSPHPSTVFSIRFMKTSLLKPLLPAVFLLPLAAVTSCRFEEVVERVDSLTSRPESATVPALPRQEVAPSSTSPVTPIQTGAAAGKNPHFAAGYSAGYSRGFSDGFSEGFAVAERSKPEPAPAVRPAGNRIVPVSATTSLALLEPTQPASPTAADDREQKEARPETPPETSSPSPPSPSSRSSSTRYSRPASQSRTTRYCPGGR